MNALQQVASQREVRGDPRPNPCKQQHTAKRRTEQSVRHIRSRGKHGRQYGERGRHGADKQTADEQAEVLGEDESFDRALFKPNRTEQREFAFAFLHVTQHDYAQPETANEQPQSAENLEGL